jgi:maltooligosyltrehalose trehalohydrolase
MQGRTRDCINVLPASGPAIIAFERECDDDCLLIVLNFEKRELPYRYDGAFKLKKLFDTSDQQWNGPGEVLKDALDSNQHLILNSESAAVFECVK